MDQRIAMNPNRLVQYLQKPAASRRHHPLLRGKPNRIRQLPLLWLGRQAEDPQLRNPQPRTPREHPHRR